MVSATQGLSWSSSSSFQGYGAPILPRYKQTEFNLRGCPSGSLSSLVFVHIRYFLVSACLLLPHLGSRLQIHWKYVQSESVFPYYSSENLLQRDSSSLKYPPASGGTSYPGVTQYRPREMRMSYVPKLDTLDFYHFNYVHLFAPATCANSIESV